MRNTGILAISLLLFTASRGMAVCGGGCSAGDEVTVEEIVLGIGIALGTGSAASCNAIDSNKNSRVTIHEILTAVNNVFSGCPHLVGDYSGSVQLDGGQHGDLALSAQAGGQINGTLTVANSLLRLLPALTLPTTALPVSGTYDAANGIYAVTGQFLDQQGGSHSIDIRGRLPGSNANVPFTLQVDNQSYIIGDLSPAGTTAPTATPTPTHMNVPTVTPPARPTVPPGCTKSGGYTRVVFSEASGTNTFVDIGQPLDLFGVAGNIVSITRGIGADSVTCPTTLTSPIVLLNTGVGGFPQDLAAGNTYPLHNGVVYMLPYIEIAQVDYSERYATDPLNGRSWRAESGTFTVDSIDGDKVTLHIDARMAPLSPSAMGTFRMQVSTIVDKVGRP
jgi:hypothetical protein